MQQALGMIETRGLLAAIESADAMLKAAEVSLLERTFVGGGLVTISVTGDVAAVKASVEAGVASVNRINPDLMVSDHVIPRPHMELDDVVVSATPLKDQGMAEVAPVEDEPATPETVAETAAITAEPLQEAEYTEEREYEHEEESEVSGEAETVETLEPAAETEQVEPQEHSSEEKKTEMPMEDVHKEDIDRLIEEHGADAVIEMITKCKVSKLRNLAREYENFGITGREISKADKKTLISEFEKYYQQF